MSELGLFPLPLVLLPSEQLPLHIFEERYKDLIRECLADDSEFGLVYADEVGIREFGTRAAVLDCAPRIGRSPAVHGRHLDLRGNRVLRSVSGLDAAGGL